MAIFNKDDPEGEQVVNVSAARDFGDGEAGLPFPVASAMAGSGRRKQIKSARIAGGLRARWDRFRNRMGTGTAPSTSEQPEDSTDTSVRWARKRQAAGGVRPRIVGGVSYDDGEEQIDEVDEVVVDREWLFEGDVKTSVTHSEHAPSPEKSGGSYVHVHGTNADRESFAIHNSGLWGCCTLFIILRWRIWPAIFSFFWVTFDDPKSENHYRKELWFMRKSLALWSSVYFVAVWVIAIIFIAKPIELADKIFYYGVFPALTVPLPFMVMYDWPRDRRFLYQVYLTISTWSIGIYNTLFLYSCGFYPGLTSHFSCGTKDFVGIFYYTTGLPCIALFGLQLDRFPAMLGALVFFFISSILIAPYRDTWIRNILDFILFHIFLLYVNYMRENAERRLYTLRDQLKIQFRATQKAQVNESKASDSKRRLTSYVFHEVRVPLNTALLALQNIEATGIIEKGQELEFRALEGSLTMMSKVLNDVLDFNRLDSGRFESVSKPYAFHQAIRSLLIPIRLATDARKLQLTTNFDRRIDEVSRQAIYEANGETREYIARMLRDESDDYGIVSGDEMRLRQIITNLASNACKFTPVGGEVRITTELIYPALSPLPSPATSPNASDPSARELGVPPPPNLSPEQLAHDLSMKHLSQHNKSHLKPLEWIVVRVEVADTGYGIPPKDMAQSKLFSAFNQTEQGRQQGGKGTGLGLALVRQIVKRSGGRLGVHSKVGEGSTFWVELPLGVGRRTFTENRSSSKSEASGLARSSSAAGVKPSTDMDEAPIVSPNLRSMMAINGLAESANLASLVLTRHVEEAGLTPRQSTSDVSKASREAEMESIPTPTSEVMMPVRPEMQTESSDETAKPAVKSAWEPQDENAARQAAPSRRPRSVSRPPGDFAQGLEVLVVDDDPLTRMLMKRMLVRLGCHVSTAENGEIAFHMIVDQSLPTPSSENTGSNGLVPQDTVHETSRKFAIVFLDNQMPVLTGVETVRKLREFGRKDFVVGVTGNALLSDQQEYLEAGVDHVLTKPVHETSLRNMLTIADQRQKGELTIHEHS